MDVTKLRDAIKLLIAEQISARKLPRVVYATLEQTSPPTFRRSADLLISSSAVQVPYKKVFLPEEVGSLHALIQEEGWQSYVYLYRVR